MYTIKTVSGKSYFLAYPKFRGNGYEITNAFYEEFAKVTSEYFSELTAEDRQTVCRSLVSVAEEKDGFTVSIRLLLRRSGKKCGDKTLIHKWKVFHGKGALLCHSY